MMSLHKSRWTWFLLPLVACFAGCLTIEENYTFKKDGSGTMEYVFDLSELAKMLEGMPGKEKTGPDNAALEKKVDELRAIKGIGKVKFKKESKGAVQRLRFQFNDITALNRALDVLMPDSTGTPHERFTWEGGTLVRTNTALASKFSDMFAGEGTDTTGAGAEMILQNMHYKYSFKFAQEIGDIQESEGVTKEVVGTKEVKLSTDFAVLSKNTKALDLRIPLK